MIPNCAALTIAGSDSGGGAGIQADLKTFSALGVFGTSVITAITAQNLEGVTAVQAVDTDVVHQQLIAVLEGFPVKAIKTGMLLSAEIIEAVAETLGDARFSSIPLIIDPVFAATSGSQLIRDDAIESLTEKLFPLASLITPNMPEAERLTETPVRNLDDMKKTAARLFDTFGVPVLLKGGHLEGKAVDFLADGKSIETFEADIVEGVNNHGSGCTLASAIAAAAAAGKPLKQAIGTAKAYINNALKNNLRLKEGLSVINHFAW